MIKMLKLDPSYVLNDFSKNSGVEFEKPNKLLNNKLLIDSLHLLRDENLTKSNLKTKHHNKIFFARMIELSKLKT